MKTVLKREWVKNAIIIFLAVMLVLTFFSNTIMNYSLPEVAAQYPMSTSITSRIRGSGTVQAAQVYNLQVQDTRTVATVEVKVGDTVQAGDTLLTLDKLESPELTAARVTYAGVKLEYDKMLVDKGVQNHATEASLQQLRDAVGQAQADLSAAQRYESNMAGYQSAVQAAQAAVSARQQDANQANTALSLLQNEKDNLTVTNKDYLEADAAVRKAQAEVARLEALTGVTTPEDPDAEEAAPTDTPELQAARVALAATITARDNLLSDLNLDVDQRIATAQVTLINAQAALDAAQASASTAQENMSAYTSTYTGPTSVDAAESALQAAQAALAAAEAAEADTAVQETYDDALADLDLQAKKEELDRAEAEVKALEEKASASTLVSRYAGVVKEVNIAAGDQTTADMPLVVVELTERGYTLTTTMNKTQAASLRAGQAAEITNLYGSDVNLTLDSITADKSDPANTRLLTFLVTGEGVEVGQQLSFSIGDRNANYDVVVPSSAVHTDADGSFVYTVAVSSSPLGSRYTVKKAAVTVLASDELNSAISGEVTTADFVITTATVPLQPGDQIRIAQ